MHITLYPLIHMQLQHAPPFPFMPQTPRLMRELVFGRWAEGCGAHTALGKAMRCADATWGAHA